MKKLTLIKFILLMGILLTMSVPQQYAHAQDCDPATGAVCPPDPQPNPTQDNNEKEKKKKPTTMPSTATPTFTPTFTPTATATPTDTATATSQFISIMPKATGTPTSLNEATPTQYFVTFVPKATPTKIRFIGFSIPAGPGAPSSANGSPPSPLGFGILGAFIIIGMVWFAVRAFGDGSVRNKSTSGPGGIADGNKQGFTGGSTGDMGDESVRENALINEQVYDAKGNENFIKMTPSGETNFMKEVRNSDSSFGDSLLDGGSGNKTKT